MTHDDWSSEFLFTLKKTKGREIRRILIYKFTLGYSCSEFSIVCTLVRNVNDDI